MEKLFKIEFHKTLLDWLKASFLSQIADLYIADFISTPGECDKLKISTILQDFIPYRACCPASPHENREE